MVEIETTNIEALSKLLVYVETEALAQNARTSTDLTVGIHSNGYPFQYRDILYTHSKRFLFWFVCVYGLFFGYNCNAVIGFVCNCVLHMSGAY